MDVNYERIFICYIVCDKDIEEFVKDRFNIGGI